MKLLALTGCLLPFVAVILSFFAYVQHIITTIGQEAYGLLIAGAIFFPIGVLHGWGIWLGFWT